MFLTSYIFINAQYALILCSTIANCQALDEKDKGKRAPLCQTTQDIQVVHSHSVRVQIWRCWRCQLKLASYNRCFSYYKLFVFGLNYISKGQIFV